MHRYTDVAPYSRSSEPRLSSSAASNASDTPERIGHQARDASLSETAFMSRTVSSNSGFEAITIEDHAITPLTHGLAPATLSAETRSSSTTSQLRSFSSPGVFALAASSPPSAIEGEMTSSPQLTEITAVPTTAVAGTGSTVQPSLPSHSSSETAPAQSSTASPVNIGSARTTGIIIGGVLGGTAALVFVMLAIICLAWRRRRNRREETDREVGAAQQQPDEATSRAGNGSNNAERRKRSGESPMILPLQGITTPRPTTLRSELIINDISPITPIIPHLSRWTSEKADVPSPAGHPAIIASTHYDENGGYDHMNVRYEPGEISPCSSSSSFPPSPNPPTPAAATAAAAADAEAHALASFLFFDSPSSRSSRRPSTRDSSAPYTALSVPPPLHRGPPPRRRHTRAGGQGGAERSRGGSVSSVSGYAADAGADVGVADSTGQDTPPPPLPARNSARSKSLRDAERPAAWI